MWGTGESIVTQLLDYYANEFNVGYPTCEVCVLTALMWTLDPSIP
jgi:hypothetical protein